MAFASSIDFKYFILFSLLYLSGLTVVKAQTDTPDRAEWQKNSISTHGFCVGQQLGLQKVIEKFPALKSEAFLVESDFSKIAYYSD